MGRRTRGARPFLSGGCRLTKVSWTKVRDRNRIARRGSEAASDSGLPIEFHSTPKKRTSKTALRAEAADAVASITRIVGCGGCGHSAQIALPPARLGARLRCSKCGEIAQ